MDEKTYSLKSGHLFRLSSLPKPRDGEVVYFTKEEWTYIREQGFTHPHKDFLWRAKYDDHRYPILPGDGEVSLTQKQIAAKYAAEILEDLRSKKTGVS